jgi:pimeloyl-ACP methyl ester carboxylesterase
MGFLRTRTRTRTGRSHRRPLIACAAATATVAVGLTVTTGPSTGATNRSTAEPATEVEAPIPTIRWTGCGAVPVARGMSCARPEVPLDYDDPTGPTIKLWMAKRSADLPDERIGTLFVNPGGPGGSSADFVGYAAQSLGKEVRQRFDIVGIDPRGVGGSAQVICRNDQQPPPYPQQAFPYTAQQTKVWLRYDRFYRTLCRDDGNRILHHMSTADTARDMDLVRQALGEEQLTYYGISYGTYLGATYAAMFPDRIRAMVVDGVLDPIAWSTGRRNAAEALPFSTRVGSGIGAWEALTSAFADCDRVGKKRCPLAGDAAGKWLRIVHRLQRGPVKVDGFRLTYPNWVSEALGALYARAGYRYLMGYIKSTYQDMFGSRAARARSDVTAARERLQRAVDRIRVPGPYGIGFGEEWPSFHGVACADSRNPTDPRAWIGAGGWADRRGPWFGRLWTWASSACANWPGSKADAYFGPFAAETSEPVLVIGNSHDPATPIHGARVLNSKLEGSRLLLMDGWGHGALGASACATSAMQRYLVDGALPPPGTVCKPNKELFPKRP